MKSEGKLKEMTKIFPLLDEIKDRELAKKVANIWYHVWEDSNWDALEQGIWNLQCPSVSVADHTRSVAKAAFEFGKARIEIYGDKINLDVLLAGALLHDVSILWEQDPGEERGSVVKSRKGKLYQHSFLGAHWALMEDLPEEIIHIIISHTWQSRVLPQTIEAIIICCVDFADGDINMFKHDGPRLMNRYKFGFTELTRK